MSTAVADPPDAQAEFEAVYQYLHELCGDDQEFLRDLLATFLNTAPQALGHLLSAVPDDLAAAGRAAHGLKGISHAIGAFELAESAAAVENAAQLGDTESARDAAQLTNEAWARLQPHLENFLAAIGG